MKTCIKNLFLLPTLITGLGLILAGRATAQTFTTLYNFTGGSDGSNPGASLISGNTLYGTTTAPNGSPSPSGTVFAVNTNGTGFTTLYSFTARAIPGNNSDGAFPRSVVLSGNTLYGTTSQGGSLGSGTLFAVNTNGTGFTVLHDFVGGYYGGNEGAWPNGGLIVSASTLYGTTYIGGSTGNGLVFRMNTDGSGFTPPLQFHASPLSLLYQQRRR